MLVLERRQAILDRVTQIPTMRTLGVRFEAFDEGYCKLTLPRDERFSNIHGAVHGGVLMTIADSAACFAVMTHTGPQEPLTTTDMNIRFLAPCLTDVTAVASVIKFGRTMCPVAVDLFDADGNKVAVAQVNYIRLAGLTGQ